MPLIMFLLCLSQKHVAKGPPPTGRACSDAPAGLQVTDHPKIAKRFNKSLECGLFIDNTT